MTATMVCAMSGVCQSARAVEDIPFPGARCGRSPVAGDKMPSDGRISWD